jgi:aminoglycoside 6'-N-acetyltransferase I
MVLTVRQMGPPDRATWARMRVALWPGETAEVHGKDVERMLAGDAGYGFVAETENGAAVGFAEITIRPFANGCDSRPVPFLEGIWVEPPFRRQGIGTLLVKHVETFVAARGFREIGSDALIENHASHAAHRGWGFSETERVVHFRKLLPAQPRRRTFAINNS